MNREGESVEFDGRELWLAAIKDIQSEGQGRFAAKLEGELLPDPLLYPKNFEVDLRRHPGQSVELGPSSIAVIRSGSKSVLIYRFINQDQTEALKVEVELNEADERLPHRRGYRTGGGELKIFITPLGLRQPARPKIRLSPALPLDGWLTELEKTRQEIQSKSLRSMYNGLSKVKE